MNPVFMTLLLIIALVFFSWSMIRRLLPLYSMQPDVRWDRPLKRLANTLKVAIGQSRLLQRYEWISGLGHAFIFWGFLVLGINTIHLVGRGYIPGWSLPFLQAGGPGAAYEFVKDLFVLLVMIGCGLALLRRIVYRPERMELSLEANLILLWIFSMMALEVIYAATGLMLHPGNHYADAAFMGVMGMSILDALGLNSESPATGTLYAIGFWGHILMVLAFLNYLPYGKHFHVITSIPGVFFGKSGNRGELPKQDFEKEDIIFGAGKMEELSWKRALDMYSCTECGRCQEHCPAFVSGKPLSPKKVMIASRNHLKEKTPTMCRAAWHTLGGRKEKAGEISASWQGEALAGEVIEDDVIWSCTTCGYCMVACPLLIEHVDFIVDIRRYMVQEESRFPKDATAVFKGWESMSNPWRLPANARADWFGETGLSPESGEDFEYLFFAGCAGSFDDTGKKVSKALVQLMQKAGIRFSFLGNEEKCCGETARRMGNEFLSQQLIRANVERFNQHNIRQIVTACPHCYNTLKNEYPQFGGNYKVLHHTELLWRLISEGRIPLPAPLAGQSKETVVYHDSCYLGRYNGIFEIPRSILRKIYGIDPLEPELHGNFSFCCGAGGGNMWMEEKSGRRISSIRLEQLLEAGSSTLATACPYCLIMLRDEINAKDLSGEVSVMDLAEIVYRTLPGEASGGANAAGPV